MKVIITNVAGGVENLVHVEMSVPEILPNEVLVKVKAISINPVDVKTRNSEGMLTGLFGDDNPKIIGWDVSGVITEVGADVPNYKAGDEVFGMINFPGHGKGYAEYVAAPASQLALKPSNITHEEAAVATLAALTAWQALVTNAKIKSGDRVLIHAGAGGVGHYAIQFAKYIGAYVIATGSEKNRAFIMALGTSEFIDYEKSKFEEVATNIDFVFDTLGDDVYSLSLLTLNKGGLIISLHPISDAQSENTKLSGIIGYRIIVTSNGDDMQEIAGLLQKKLVVSHVSYTFPFDQMADAHLQVETGRTKGKVVVTI
jgi:NADPH:quinone reductase-like Zn-dependent oxidoreductase